MCAANYDHLGVPDLSSGRLNTILSEETEGEGDGEESNDTQTRGGRKNRLVRRHQRWSDSNHRGKMELSARLTISYARSNGEQTLRVFTASRQIDKRGLHWAKAIQKNT